MDQNGSGAEKPLQVENISQLIAEILEIDHFILGDKKDDFLIRFRGFQGEVNPSIRRSPPSPELITDIPSSHSLVPLGRGSGRGNPQENHLTSGTIQSAHQLPVILDNICQHSFCWHLDGL